MMEIINLDIQIYFKDSILLKTEILEMKFKIRKIKNNNNFYI